MHSYNYVCFIMHIVKPVIQWDLPKAVGLHGTAITGSCNATAYPRPNVMVIASNGCDYKQERVIPIGRHTNKAVFTIKNVTKSCEKIHCYIPKFYHINSTELLIIGM